MSKSRSCQLLADFQSFPEVRCAQRRYLHALQPDGLHQILPAQYLACLHDRGLSIRHERGKLAVLRPEAADVGVGELEILLLLPARVRLDEGRRHRRLDDRLALRDHRYPPGFGISEHVAPRGCAAPRIAWIDEPELRYRARRLRVGGGAGGSGGREILRAGGEQEQDSGGVSHVDETRERRKRLPEYP